jgi:hypothetical protein
MSSVYEAESYEADGWEFDGEYEPDEPEAIRPGSRRRAPASPRRPYAPQTPSPGNYVTKQEFQTALDGVRSDMRTNAAAIRSVGTQVDSLATRTRREIAGLRNEFRNSAQMLGLLPLLAAPKQVGPTGADVLDTNRNVAIPAGTTLARPPEGITQILPLLLLSGGFGGGAGGSGSNTSQQGMGMDQTALLVLAVALSGRP